MIRIVGKVKLDENNKIVLEGLRSKKRFEKGIRFAINPEREMIEVLDATKFHFGLEQELTDLCEVKTQEEDRCEVRIPDWLISEIDGREIYVVVDSRDSSIWLSPKTHDIL